MARTILVADDNPLIRKMLCRIFEAEEDYDLCAEATNGQEGIVLALKHRPELIILDPSMPILNSLDAARRLKEIMVGIPIILFTQYAEFPHTSLLGDSPFDRIVSKTKGTQLIRHVRELLPAA
jgi:two-component system, LytTR family, response regulator AlgR